MLWNILYQRASKFSFPLYEQVVLAFTERNLEELFREPVEASAFLK